MKPGSDAVTSLQTTSLRTTAPQDNPFHTSRRQFLRTSLAAAVLLSVKTQAAWGLLDSTPDPYLEKLLKRMTLEEKAGQLHLTGVLSPRLVEPNFQKINPFAAKFSPEKAAELLARQQELIRRGGVGLMAAPDEMEATIYAQTAAVKESRLGIPLMFGGDVIHGQLTVFPVPLGEAASFEPELAERTARACAVEATQLLGLDLTYAPMVDIGRDQRWGRVVEGAGEDVLLGCRFAAARVRGFQGKHPGRADSLLACPKHFAAYGAAESGLDYAGNFISERVLHEIYLAPFQAAFDAGAHLTMASFNTIDGVPSTGNAHLLTEILRGQMGFKGAVISDFESELELVAHGFADSRRDAAKKALSAGCDIGMISGIFPQFVPELVRSGELDEAVLDQAVRRILSVKQLAGLFDNPFARLNLKKARKPAPKAHLALAREAGQKSIVLLKNNDQLLPLSKSARIALIGPFAQDTENLNGPWSPFVKDISQSLEAGFKEVMGHKGQLLIEAGCGIETPLEGGIERALQTAAQVDVVVLAVGESARMSGESSSRPQLILPECQQSLAEALAKTGKPMVVVLKNGRALVLEGAIRQAPAILVTWFLGTQTGGAIADVLFGVVAPQGRLPVSFPLFRGQQPYYYAHESSGRPTKPGETPHFSKHFLGYPDQPLYPFGHGLTYTEIAYGPTQIEKLEKGEALAQVSCSLSNRGQRAAIEVVQLYVHDQAASVVQPVRKLVDFKQVKLKPGETKQVQFQLTLAQLAFMTRDLKIITEPGKFSVWIAPSAGTGTAAEFTL